MQFFLAFIFAFAISLGATVLVRRLALRYDITDKPERDPGRKIHAKPQPLLGGLAVICSFLIVSIAAYILDPLLQRNIPLTDMAALWFGSVILAVGGFFDDRYSLVPKKLFVVPLLAVLAIILAGIGIPHITNPFGGKIILHQWLVGGVSIFSVLFVLVWLSGMIYTTKFLDGLDGLASSIGIVAGLALFALSFTEQVNQPYTALLIAILIGALAGFLVFNWHPARIFLGESGSTFIGFMLGVLAIIAGGKVATAFLVMGVPILDVAWVILRRLVAGVSPFKGDRQHLHYRLLDLGLSQRSVVIVYITVSAIFGGAAVFLQSLGKFWELIVLLLVMVLGGAGVVVAGRKHLTKALQAMHKPGDRV